MSILGLKAIPIIRSAKENGDLYAKYKALAGCTPRRALSSDVWRPTSITTWTRSWPRR